MKIRNLVHKHSTNRSSVHRSKKDYSRKGDDMFALDEYILQVLERRANKKNETLKGLTLEEILELHESEND